MPLRIDSKENSLYGTDHYRDDTVTNPRAWQPTVKHTVNLNKAGSNANVIVRSDDYVVADVDGRRLMTDKFIMETKFTALQEVTAVAERARIYDSHVAFLVASRTVNLLGKLPDEPLTVA